MRIVIDIQACQLELAVQSGRQPQPQPELDLVLALVRSAGEHTVLLVLNAAFDDSIDPLRATFAPFLPREHLKVFEIADQKHAASDNVPALLRASFLSALRPDLVFVPGAWRSPDQLCTIDEDAAPTVLGLHANALADAGVEGRQFGRTPGLAAMLVARDPETCDTLRQRWPARQLLALDASSPGAAAAQLWPAFAELVAARVPVPSPVRPRLAYISPLPPQKSGIADYSVELIAQLDRYYNIELITDHPGPHDPNLSAAFQIRDVAWFDAHAGDYQRVVYHFGNSNAHRYMFGLLQRHPGIVVLHDFFLSGVLNAMEMDDTASQVFQRTLFESHGYSALVEQRKIGHDPSVWAYPTNKNVLDRAAGVIVHSAFSRRLAEQWYGPGTAEHWRTLPLIRGLDGDATVTERRAAARARLGLEPDDFLICSFGMLGPIKLNDRLLDAFLASPLAANPRCRLVFVGENDPEKYGARVLRKIETGPKDRISITGFVSAADYALYLDACDAAVQLRRQTRGETSASVLDCLLHGAPTIINAHGSNADLPDDILIMLPDDCSSEDLAAALLELHDSPARRATLSARGREYIEREHAPARVGALFHEAIEQLTNASPLRHYRKLLSQLAPLPPRKDLRELASAIAYNQPVLAPRQLLIDVSALAQSDHKTGIQRVVRSIVLALIAAPPPGFRIEPVFTEGANLGYRYARRFIFEMLGLPSLKLEDAPIEVRSGDVFLGLDLFTTGTAQNQGSLLEMRRRGVKIHFVIYDLLPLLRPKAFPFEAERYYANYIDAVALVSDGLICISRAVADELSTWLETRPNRRRTPLQLGYFHLGADIDASAPSRGLPDNAEAVLSAARAAPTLLMVGTLEPRKGQTQALDAFELLWAAGVDINLVIVGKNGWMVDNLAKRLDQHPQRERRLFWLPGVSDEMLLQLYANTAALLAASEGEGFGLPLIEAAQHGLPIIARGLPVFREIAGEHAFYFDGVSGSDLAAALQKWLPLHLAGQAPASTSMPWLNWQQSAAQLMEVCLHGRWYRGFSTGGTAVQLLVDVSAVVRQDLRSGIERVVRAQLTELMRVSNTRYQVLPVYLTDEGGYWHYRHARKYAQHVKGLSDHGITEDVVRAGAGDVFYCPDLFPGPTVAAAQAGLYRDWRSKGVHINFLIHDLLPVLRPEFFPPGADAGHGNWLACVAAEADQLICISAAVADEMRAWMRQHADLLQGAAPALAVLHHGADIAASNPAGTKPQEAAPLLAELTLAPTFLMVGTIEPRKGHLQAIEAFEQLWAQGVDAHLVIVGREGWTGVPKEHKRTIPAILERLRRHPQAGKRLHWLNGIDDDYLERLYAVSACLLAPSEGEGFGLPLIEAARQGLPILARDLPVFREVAGEHAAYFKGADAADLANAVNAWLASHNAGTAPASTGMPWLTWEQNAQLLGEILVPKVKNDDGN
jgi:glycosyltransferase involved in cell wall biosynthesis